MADSMNENQADSSDTMMDLSEVLKKLFLESDDEKTGDEEAQETANGNETPQQKMGSSSGTPRGGTQRKLDFDASLQNNGEWLKGHTWENKRPSGQELMATTVVKSEVYPVSEKWEKAAAKKVDLQKIYLNLPQFIDEMKGPSCRQELEDVLQIGVSALNINSNSTLLKAIECTNTKLSPHVFEIAQKENGVVPKDNASFRNPDEKNRFKAFSLTAQENPHQPSENNYWFLDCEYMLKMYLPKDSLQWFHNDDQEEKRTRKINPEKTDKRWVFIPSFRRAKIALLDWPQDNIMNQETTIRILVVRPSEFKEYVQYCGHKFPVICLPHDEIGAGYPRYWIQKIALRLELQFIWMIDDSVECFYEYHPEQKPPEGSYSKYRRRKFGLVFERIEDFVKEPDDNEKLIAAMSPRRVDWRWKPQQPFVCKPPQCAVYLNLRALSEKNVYYRPELKTFEDMIFGYECEQNGLKVYMDNRIHLQDHNWKDTGASSASVKSK